MKQQIQLSVTAAVLFLFTIGASAQTETKTKTVPWVSAKGYWVVENNIRTPRINTVYFYTNDDQLVYTEKLNGVRLNTERRSVKMKLKEVLDRTLLAWERNKVPAQNLNYVMMVMK